MAGNGHLNGAYYGPSIPPPSKTYHRPGSSTCCCNPFSCCCTCLMNCICTCICQILCTLLVIGGIIVLICYLIFRPQTVKFHVTHAALNQFNLQNDTLHYNMTLNLNIRNPNKRIGIYYDSIEARAFYGERRFSTVELGRFYQGTKTTSNVTVVSSGVNVVVFGDKERERFDKERGDGVYGIDVKLYMKIRLKFWFVKSGKVKPKIDCDLKVPLFNGTVNDSGVFESKRCDFDWR